MLLLPGTGGGDGGGSGDRGESAPVDRMLLRGGQAGDGAGRIRSALLARVASSRDAVAAGAGVSDRGEGEGEQRRECRGRGGERERQKGAADLVPLTEPEIQRLLLAMVWPQLRTMEKAPLWLHWRRRHQAVVKACHHRKRR